RAAQDPRRSASRRLGSLSLDSPPQLRRPRARRDRHGDGSREPLRVGGDDGLVASHRRRTHRARGTNARRALRARVPRLSGAYVAPAPRAVLMRVVVLQHESIEGPGVWAETILEHGASVECVLVPKRGVPEDAERADLVISMGGSMSVNDRLPWIATEIALLAKRISSGAPLLGVCLGSQLIA